MTLMVSNAGVPPSDTTASPGLITKTLSTTINPFSGAFQWKVDVPPGTYRLSAILSPDDVFQSGIFDVVLIPDGDISCLLPSSTTRSPSSGTPSPSSQTSIGPASSTSEDTGPIISSTPTSSALPVGGSGRSNTATIVGVVLGIVALGIVVLAVYFFIRRKKPSKASHGPGKPGGRWNGLGSTDSRTVLSNTPTAKGASASRDRQSSSGQRRNHHFPGDSMASMQITDESFGMAGAEKYASSRKNSAATTYDDHEGVVLTTLPALPHSGRDVTTGRRPSYPDGLLYFDDRSKGISRSLQSTPYMESTTVSRAPSATSTPYLSNGADMNPKTPPANTTDLKSNRNSIGAGNGRRRKPVPAYDPSDLSPSAQPSPITSPPTLTMPSPAITSAMLDHEASYTQHSSSGASLPAPASSSGHYTTRNVTARTDGSESSEALAHKTSFGPPGVAEGKQLHYLMPDLPADVRIPRR